MRLVSVGLHGMERGNGLPFSVTAETPGACRGWFAPTAADYDAIDRWGFNSVRLPVSWANLEPNPPLRRADGSVLHHYDGRYVIALDGIVTELARRGIGVILDMHQWFWSPAFKGFTNNGATVCQGSGMPAWLYPAAQKDGYLQAKCDFFADRMAPGVPLPSLHSGFIDAWRFLLDRYSEHQNVVGADIISEPYANRYCEPKDLRLDDFYRKVGSAIRDVNPRVLLIFEDSQFSPKGRFALSGPLRLPNAVYSFHLYTQEWADQGMKRVTAFWNRARAWRVPAWLGEFNRFGRGSTTPPDWPAQMTRMLAYFKEQGIGWSYWALHGEDPLLDKDGRPNQRLVEVLRSGM